MARQRTHDTPQNPRVLRLGQEKQDQHHCAIRKPTAQARSYAHPGATVDLDQGAPHPQPGIPSLSSRRPSAPALRTTTGQNRRTASRRGRGHYQRSAHIPGNEPAPVPEPFAGTLVELVHRRPNLRTAGGGSANPWLFPAQRPGKHLDAITLQHDLTRAGVSVLAARNSALRTLVAEIPPPIVAKLLGFSDNCTQRHAQMAAQPWSRYVT